MNWPNIMDKNDIYLDTHKTAGLTFTVIWIGKSVINSVPNYMAEKKNEFTVFSYQKGIFDGLKWKWYERKKL